MYDFLIVWWYVLYERLFWVFSRLFRSCVDDFAEMCATLLQRQANLKLFPMWFRIRLEFLWCTPSSSHSHTQNIHCKVITNNYWFLQWDSSTAKNYYYYSSVLSFSSHLLADVCELMCKKKYVDLVNDREMVSILICALRNSNEFSFSFFCFSLFDTEKKFLWFGFSHFLIMTTVFFLPTLFCLVSLISTVFGNYFDRQWQSGECKKKGIRIHTVTHPIWYRSKVVFEDSRELLF